MTFTEQLILKLLEWPFLFLAAFVVFVAVFRKQLQAILSRGGLTLTWGDKSFAIAELPEQLNESFAPVTDDIEELRQRLDSLDEEVSRHRREPKKAAQVDLAEARERMLDALSEGKYRWRSIERLASIGGFSVEQAANALRPLNEVVFSRGKSGRTIARLSSR